MNFLRAPIFLLLAVFLLLAGCAGIGSSGPLPESSPTPELIPTETPLPSPTPLPDMVVLLAPAEMDPAQAQGYLDLLSGLAAESGLVLEARPALSADDLGSHIRLVFAPQPPENFSALFSASPQTMFLAIGGEGLPEASNLAMIRFDPAHQAFTAGFLAMLVTFDWRSSALLPDTPESAAFAAAFRNGARYFCGRCGTFYAPYADFPLIGAAPAGSGPVEFKAALDTLLTYSVYSVYLSPEAASPEILGEIFNRQLVMIGGQSPPTEVRDRWAATIRPDLSSTIRKLWPDLLAGKGGGVHAAALEITDIQPQILTQGRLDLVNRMREDLSSGLIDPLAPALQ